MTTRISEHQYDYKPYLRFVEDASTRSVGEALFCEDDLLDYREGRPVYGYRKEHYLMRGDYDPIKRCLVWHYKGKTYTSPDRRLVGYDGKHMPVRAISNVTRFNEVVMHKRKRMFEPEEDTSQNVLAYSLALTGHLVIMPFVYVRIEETETYRSKSDTTNTSRRVFVRYGCLDDDGNRVCTADEYKISYSEYLTDKKKWLLACVRDPHKGTWYTIKNWEATELALDQS